MKKFILKTLVFVIAYTIAVQVIKHFRPDRANANDYYTAKREVFEQKKPGKQYNALFVGSSRIYRQVVPQLFDSLVNQACPQLRLSSFNLGSPATFPPESYYFTEEILKNDTGIRYIFLELCNTPVYTDNLFTPRGNYWLTPAHMTEAAQEIRFSKRKDKAKELGFLMAGTLQHLLTLRELTYERKHPQQADGPAHDGFLPLDVEAAWMEENRKNHQALLADTTIIHRRAEQFHKLFDERKKHVPNSIHLAWIHRLMEECRSRQVKLIFLIPPFGPDEEVMALYYSIPAEQRMQFADPAAFPAFYVARHCFDTGHLNSTGARMFTRELANAFVVKYSPAPGAVLH